MSAKGEISSKVSNSSLNILILQLKLTVIQVLKNQKNNKVKDAIEILFYLNCMHISIVVTYSVVVTMCIFIVLRILRFIKNRLIFIYIGLIFINIKNNMYY